ncbi:MAG: putative DNA-binding transcriptional regulator [Methanomassiliicoccales archaeon PtaB.Bin215]|nr:MAG: putative DNA-binding transcriptional regulator [Methanomassiliicoccales archaeon PtaB.Bin215]
MSVVNAATSPPRKGSRERISAAAFALFAERGFDGTTTRAIAERAGVNEVTIFRTFGSKEALFRQVAMEMLPLRRIKAGVDFRIEGTAEDVLVQNARLVLGILRDNLHIFMILVGELWRHPELKDEVGFEMFDQAVEFLAAQMMIMIEDGRLRNVDPFVAARSWMGTVQSHFLSNYLIGAGTIDPDAEERLLRGWADIFVNGAGRR